MEKNNSPTKTQLTTIYWWIEWCMPPAEAREAVHWLGKYASRKEVSIEMNRLYSAKKNYRLTKDTVFSSKIWAGYIKDRE